MPQSRRPARRPMLCESFSDSKRRRCSDDLNSRQASTRMQELLAAIAKVRQDSSALAAVSPELQDQRAVVLAALSAPPALGPNPLLFASQRLRGDREVGLAAVNRDAFALQLLSPELQDDREIVLAALRSPGWPPQGSALEFASDRLRRDREVVLAAMSQLPSALQHASAELRDDREFVLETIETKIWGHSSLLFASERLRCDRDVVLAAIARFPSALQFVPPELQDDREIVLAAIRAVHWDRHSLRFASQRLQHDREVLLAVVRRDPLALQSAPELQGDREVVLKAVSQDARALAFAASDLRGDRKLVLDVVEAVKERRGTISMPRYLGLLLRETPLRGDPEVVRATVLVCGEALRFATDDLRSDREVVLTATRQDCAAVTHSALPEEVWETISKAADSKLAQQGEEGAPAVNVQLEMQEFAVRCKATFGLSGRSVEFYMDEEATVGDLAVQVVDAKPEDMEAFERVFLLLHGRQPDMVGTSTKTDELTDGGVYVTPWHWNIPLFHFVPARSGCSSREGGMLE